jgi:hypothetical protein
MTTTAQLPLLPATRTASDYAEFVAWKELPGAGEIMAMYYRHAGYFYRRYCESGVTVSVRLIEETIRDAIRQGRARGVDLDGYALNSHLTKPILLHMLDEHPEWQPMFKLREQQ